MRYSALLVVGALLATVAPAFGKTITKCGASSGYRFDVPGPLSGVTDAHGWSKDQISQGEFSLIIDGKEADIITTDAVGTRSSKADGARVIILNGPEPRTFVVMVVYTDTGTLEHFLFSLKADGSGDVVWGTSRAGGLLPKSSLMHATCHAP